MKLIACESNAMLWLSGSKNSNPSLIEYSWQAQTVRFVPCDVHMYAAVKNLDAVEWYPSGTEAS